MSRILYKIITSIYEGPWGSTENLLRCESMSKMGDVGDERMDYAEIRD